MWVHACRGQKTCPPAWVHRGRILGACGRPHSLEYPQPDDNRGHWNKIDNKIKLCEWRPESRGAARGTEKPGLRALSTWGVVTLCPEHFRSVPGGNFTVGSDQTADFTVGPWQDRGRIFFFLNMQLGDSDSIHFSLVNCVDNSFLKLLSQENYNMPPEHLVQRVKRSEPWAEGSYAFTQGQRVPWELCRRKGVWRFASELR